jgi:hypothetical protein
MHDNPLVRKDGPAGVAAKTPLVATVEQVALQVETEFARYVEMRDHVRREFSSRRRVLLQVHPTN